MTRKAFCPAQTLLAFFFARRRLLREQPYNPERQHPFGRPHVLNFAEIIVGVHYGQSQAFDSPNVEVVPSRAAGRRSRPFHKINIHQS
jgi:hypothetical protein